MLKPSGLSQFKGIDAKLMLECQARAKLLPCINGGVMFAFRLEANEAGDPDPIGYLSGALAQNAKLGFGIEIPEGQVWFPYWIRPEAYFNGSTSYDCTFSPINIETIYTRNRRGTISNFQWSVPVSNQYAAFATQSPQADYYRIGENPHNLSGVFKPQLYLGMWPSGSTIWFSLNADNALGISGGIDRMLFRGLVNIVYTGDGYLETLREGGIADREIMRRLAAEGVTGFPNTDL